MPAKKGTLPPNAGKGRPKGVPNKVTSDVRATIALIAGRNIPKFEGWLVRVARRDPARAAELLLRALEYHIPKQARTELTGKDGAPLPTQVVFEIRSGRAENQG